MKLGLGIGLINVVPAKIEYIPTGYDAFVTADNEQFVTDNNKDFNVLEP